MRCKACALVLVMAAALWANCSSDKQTLDENLTVDNVTPLGSVGGVVLDAVTQAPVAGGVDVTVLSGGGEPITTSTDGNGYFLVTDVPASGNVIVMIQSDGYYSAQLNGAFNNAAGNFPVDNAILSLGPIGLIPANRSMTLRLVSETGEAVPNVSLTATTNVKYLDMTDGGAMSVGRVTVDATANSDGVATFNGLPDYIGLGNLVDDTLFVKIPPIDTDGDDIYEYPGGSFWFNYGNTGGPERIVELVTNYPTNLAVDYSNVAALESTAALPTTLPIAGPIHVLFNIPIDENSLYVRVFNEFETETIQTETVVDGRSLTINFPQPLGAGAKYHLQIHAVSSVGNQISEKDFYAPFYTAASEPLSIVSVVRDTDSDPMMPDFVVHFNQPIGTGNNGRNQNFYNSRCVLWFDTEIGATVGVGNDPGEWGADSCSIGAAYAFKGDEEVVGMPGAYPSGYTTRWRFTAPQSGGQPMTQGTQFYIIFSEIAEGAYVITTPNGEVVHDFMAQQIP
mgnify:CR=1 FL=1